MPGQRFSLYYLGLGALFIYLTYVGAFWVLQRQFLYPGQHIPPPEGDAEMVAGLEAWWIETRDGPVEAWFIPAPGASDNRPAPVAIFTHGNGELIDDWPPELSGFLERGVSLLLVEYPGYGRSAGKPSQRGIETVVIAAYDRLVARPEVDRRRIIAYGRSLGGGAACILAANRPIAALILQSTFVNTREFAAQYWLPGILVRDPFDNEAVVRDYHGPILIMHGIADKLIPVAHAERLFQSAPNATLITYPCGHNDCPPGWDQFWRDVSAFLRQVEVTEVLGAPPDTAILITA